MEFYEVLDRVLILLQRHGRASYRSLKRQFNLDDDYLEDVKEALLYTYSDRLSDDGQGLVWSGEPRESFPDIVPETDREIVIL